MHVPSGPLLQLPALVAELGYEWIELSPREDFTPFFNHPRVDDIRVQELKKALRIAGVGVSSMLPMYKWSDPDEEDRQAAVRYWKRAIEIAADLGGDTMNSRFDGNPREAAVCERQFWRSMEELLPLFEKEGVRLEPHPGDLLTMVHVADSFNHQGSAGMRYLVDPPGSQVTVHQHLDIGQREVDFDEFFTSLEANGFDGIVTACVLAWEERARESSTFMRDTIGTHLGTWAQQPTFEAPSP